MHDTLPPMIGTRYRLDTLLGEGGMGTVYRGLDTQSDQVVAIKLLKPEAARLDSGLIERFAREAEALSHLNHPNIVKVFTTLQEGSQHYIIMEYVGGGSLQDLLRRGDPLPIVRVLTIGLELADALTRSHHLKIIHRDLKPANVLIADDGSVRLTDFGVAQFGAKERVTQSGVIIGTMDYLCPEVLQGQGLDERADIWAFGVLLFELLTGQRPFTGDTISQVITAILTRPLPDLEALRPETPLALVDLLYRMLEKDPIKRVPSVRLVGAELERILKADVTPFSNAVEIESFPAIALWADNTLIDSTPLVARIKNNLPAQATPFVERGPEISTLQSLISDPQSRLITIVAQGGMGKTRLALELGSRFAAENAPAFPDGIFFVELAPLLSADTIPAAIVDAIGLILPAQGVEPQQHLLNYFAEKRLLLILDNFEHVLDGAAIVSAIIQAESSVKTLVTSRERLNLQGETVLRLEGMAFPKQNAVDNAASYDAVKLFVQSARQLQPTLELADDDLRHVTRICSLVDGLPLGLVLAAAWVETLSLHEIADEIAANLDFLESEARDLPARQRSIRAVFDSSWRLLTDSEQQSMMKLSVFRGGFTRESAQVVAGASLKTLAALVNKSLLRRDPASGRYEIHELVRQYAEALLDERRGLDQTRNVHLAHFAALATEAERQLRGERQSEWVQRLTADHDNLRAALTWAYHGGSPAQGLEIAAGLFMFWFRCGYEREGLGWVLEGLKQTMGVTVLRANGWQTAATLAAVSGEMHSFSPAKQNTIAYAEQLNLKNLIAMHNYVTQIYFNPDDITAFKTVETGIAMLREAGDVEFLTSALGMYADRSRVQADFEKAERLYHEQLECARITKNGLEMAHATLNLGRLAIHRRDYQHAGELLGQALRALRQMAWRLDVAETLIHFGTVQMYQGRYGEAESSLAESVSLWRDIGQWVGTSHALHCLANVKLHQGDDVRAAALIQECFRVAQVQDLRGTFLFVEFSVVRLLIVARLACRRNAYEQAAQMLGAAAAIEQQIRFRLEPFSQDEFEEARAEARAELGEDSFSTSWKAGLQMEEAAAIQFSQNYVDTLLPQ
jgi:serine/threonine protein kinase/tetratricopeptide (TPR) repeat protein